MVNGFGWIRHMAIMESDFMFDGDSDVIYLVMQLFDLFQLQFFEFRVLFFLFVGFKALFLFP